MADKITVAETAPPVDPLTPAVVEQVRLSLAGLRFGQLLIVVHEGTVVQIDRTERKRLTRNGDMS